MDKSFTLEDFLRSLKGKPLADIISEVNREIERVESLSYRIKGAVSAREHGSVKYYRALERFLHFIFNNSFDGLTHQREAKLFFSVLHDLVDRGCLPPSALDIQQRIRSLPL